MDSHASIVHKAVDLDHCSSANETGVEASGAHSVVRLLLIWSNDDECKQYSKS